MNKKKLFLLVFIIVVIAGFAIVKIKLKTSTQSVQAEVSPNAGSIQTVISTTGTVLPKNRLEIKPPINGRIENILVKEGEHVQTGTILAWMSSTERAALLDAARSDNEEKLKYWQEVYKPIALIAPIEAEVIVATTQPGQTVTANEAVIVLSDKLIVRAQVDETDIGKIKLGQKAIITIDAYPDMKIKASVEHLYYESKTVNNVNIYEVDLIPEEVLQFFRSGMNASIDFIEQSKENALLLPLEAITREKDTDYVMVKDGASGQFVKREVKLGISDENNVEIVSGVNANDTVMVKSSKYVLPKANNIGTNPFMPFRRSGASRR